VLKCDVQVSRTDRLPALASRVGGRSSRLIESTCKTFGVRVVSPLSWAALSLSSPRCPRCPRRRKERRQKVESDGVILRRSWIDSSYDDTSMHPHKKLNLIGVPQDLYAEWTLGKELGRGQFGVTFLATHNVTGEKAACKCISKRKLMYAPDPTSRKLCPLAWKDPGG
jgi:hypothetical protein